MQRRVPRYRAGSNSSVSTINMHMKSHTVLKATEPLVGCTFLVLLRL